MSAAPDQPAAPARPPGDDGWLELIEPPSAADHHDPGLDPADLDPALIDPAGADPARVDPARADSGRRWRFDLDFLQSNWVCRWGVNCVGILDEPAPELGQGCCSVGAQLLDTDEALHVAALAMTLDPARFQHHGGPNASLDDYFDPDRSRTRVIDGACVFLNRPGFEGGAGCALHLGALDEAESPTDWKPAICWQLPIKVVEVEQDGVPVSIVRRWDRSDWGPGGDDMAWVCTERQQAGQTSAYVGDRPVIESMAAELEALLGPELFDQVRTAVAATDQLESRRTDTRPEVEGERR